MPETGSFVLLGAQGTTSFDRVLVRLVGILSFAAGVAFFLAGVATNDPRWLAGIVGPFLVAITALWQTLVGRERIVPVLIVSGLATVVQNRLLGIPELSQASAIVLAFIGIVGALFVRRHVVVYIAGYAAMIFLTRLWWVDQADEDLYVGFITAVVAAVSVIFGSAVMIWLRKQLSLIAGRFRNVFDHAPVSLWEEDFSAVGAWIDELRARGITDIEAYLTEHPDEVTHAASLINVVSVNEAAVELMGAASSEDLLGPLDSVTECSTDSYIAQVKAVWNGQERAFSELKGVHTLTGREMEALLYWSAPMVDGTPDLARVAVAVVDITDQRDAERQLYGLLRSKDEFVATVSHELRNPLTAVVGLAEELRDNEERFSASERRELVALIADQGLEVSKIVDDLLVAARAEAGTLDVMVERLDMVGEAAAVLHSQGMDSVLVKAPDEVPEVFGDGGRVRQIVRNLLTNSQRYGGGAVRIAITRRDSFVVLEVRDSGDPLPATMREAIFDPYYRAMQTRGVTASVGLGLTVSRDLARRMGGDLAYDHDGMETIFALSLRLADPDPEATAAMTPVASAARLH